MVLKEAYTYQNYLSNLIGQAMICLNKRSFVTETKQIHHREKVNPKANDETIIVNETDDVEYTPTDLINLMDSLIDEKDRLCKAIADAKSTTDIDIDTAISMNKVKQAYISCLNSLASMKSRTIQNTGEDYKFNEAGDQVRYFYPMEEIVSINYDRNVVKGIIKKLKKETDEISLKLDQIQLNTEVDFEPKYSMDDSLEDVVSK